MADVTITNRDLKLGPAKEVPKLSRESVFDMLVLLRRAALWSGNRWEADCLGAKLILQRRRAVDRKWKASGDTYIARADHKWVVIIHGFDFQRLIMVGPRPSLTNAQDRFKECEYEFRGDEELFCKEYVFMKLALDH